jgi:alcohol dehydrogenase
MLFEHVGIMNATLLEVPFQLVTCHEIAGRIDAVGDDVQGWAAVGYFGGNCGICVACRECDFIQCKRIQVPDDAYPGGYSEAVEVPSSALLASLTR